MISKSLFLKRADYSLMKIHKSTFLQNKNKSDRLELKWGKIIIAKTKKDT